MYTIIVELTKCQTLLNIKRYNAHQTCSETCESHNFTFNSDFVAFHYDLTGPLLGPVHLLSIFLFYIFLQSSIDDMMMMMKTISKIIFICHDSVSVEIQLTRVLLSRVQVIRRLLDKPTARVVIVFLRVEDATALLRATRRLNVTGRFVWIASDGWGKEELPVLHGNEIAAEGALTIELQTTPLPEFDQYFRHLRPVTNDRNPWYREYWERVHECIFDVDAHVDEQRHNSTNSNHNVSNIEVLLRPICNYYVLTHIMAAQEHRRYNVLAHRK